MPYYLVFWVSLVVIVLIPEIVFAGQSFNGRETADETLKTILMTALCSFISWLSWKRLLDKSQKSEEKQTQLPSSDPRRTPSDVVLTQGNFHSAIHQLITPQVRILYIIHVLAYVIHQ